MSEKRTTASAEYAASFASKLSIPHLPEPHVGYRILTRAIDLIGATTLLLSSSLLLFLAALAIKLTSPGPVVFRHRRLGWRGKPFLCYKFRTMISGAHARREEIKQALNISGSRVKPRLDPRVTAVGRVLRRFSLDEFPQLVNVIRGDMSLVGPRPLPIEELEQCTPEQLQRLAVKPGLTCLWQISGRSEIGLEGQIQLDFEYIQKRSLWKDMSILMRTPWAVLSGRGAY